GEIRDADRDLKEAHATEKDSPDKAKEAAKQAQERRTAALKAVGALRKQIAGYDEEQRKAREDLRQRFPAYSRLVNPPPARPSDIAKQLGDGEVLVSVYTTRAHTFVWAIARSGEPALHVANAGADAIAQDVRRLRSTLELGNRTTPAPFN